jgi:ribosomal protein L37AE/L43A
MIRLGELVPRLEQIGERLKPSSYTCQVCRDTDFVEREIDGVARLVRCDACRQLRDAAIEAAAQDPSYKAFRAALEQEAAEAARRKDRQERPQGRLSDGPSW